jgi:hypothetical protein
MERRFYVNGSAVTVPKNRIDVDLELSD